MKCVCGKLFSINPPERDRAPRDGEGRCSRDEVDTGSLKIIDARTDESIVISATCPWCERTFLARICYKDFLHMPNPDELHKHYGAHAIRKRRFQKPTGKQKGKYRPQIIPGE